MKIFFQFFFLELKSNISQPKSTHNKTKSKIRTPPIHSNPPYELLHYVKTNFLPDFHRDGKTK